MGQARPGQAGPKGTKRAEGLAHLWSHKALDYVRVNPCTPLDSEGVHMKGGGDPRGRVALSKAPAVKLRPQRCAAQANCFFVVFFKSHAVLRSSITTGGKRLEEFETVLVMEDGRQDFTHERTRGNNTEKLSVEGENSCCWLRKVHSKK